MKIVIIGTAYPYRGGLATFNERLARQLQDEGHEVSIMTFTLQYPGFLFPGKTQYTSDPQPAELHITRQLNSINPLNWIRLGHRLRQLQPDLIICCYWMAFFAPAYGTICRIAKRNKVTRCIALVHNMFPHEKSVLDRLFAPYFTATQDGFVALSDSVAQDIQNTIGPQRRGIIGVAPHPIYDHYGERISHTKACKILDLDDKNDYILFFGLVRAYKGLDLLIDALAIVKDELPKLHLVIAGEFYEEEDKYREQIARHQLANRVIIRNEFIADAQLKYYFGASSLITQPYRSATQSGVTQVAFHFEKPMLVTNVGGLGEIVHHGKMGYAVEPTPEAISEALRDYYQQHRQEAFTQYLRTEKKKYTWARLTHEFMQLATK